MALEKIILSQWEQKTTGARPIWTPRAWLVEFMKEITRDCYIRNI